MFDIVGKVIAGSKSDQHCRAVEDIIRGTEHSFIVKKSPEDVDHIIILVASSVVLCICVFSRNCLPCSQREVSEEAVQTQFKKLLQLGVRVLSILPVEVVPLVLESPAVRN